MLAMLSVLKKNIFYLVLAIASGFIIFFILLPQKRIYDANHVDIKGIYLIKPLPTPHFTLTTNHGQTFTQNNLKGRWSFLFFGFTRCNMVCPITMHALKDTYQSLTTLPKNQRPQVIFISIDPENDNLNTLNQYVTAFNPSFIGARTNQANTKALEKQFHLTSFKTNATITHSADVILINPRAEIQAYFSFPLQPENVVQAYKKIINKPQ